MKIEKLAQYVNSLREVGFLHASLRPNAIEKLALIKDAARIGREYGEQVQSLCGDHYRLTIVPKDTFEKAEGVGAEAVAEVAWVLIFHRRYSFAAKSGKRSQNMLG
jgi:hypothetical protein